MISIHRQLEMARNVADINQVRERIELEIDVEDAKRGYEKSCDVLENIFNEESDKRNNESHWAGEDRHHYNNER